MKLKTFLEKRISESIDDFCIYENGNQNQIFTKKEYESGNFDKKWLKADVTDHNIGYGICTGFRSIEHIYVDDPDKPPEGVPCYFYIDSCGDGVSTGSGWIKLTPEQARVVAYALNKGNWNDFTKGGGMVDGDTRIYLDKWKTVKEIEGKNK